jgi:hypothetical protein
VAVRDNKSAGFIRVENFLASRVTRLLKKDRLVRGLRSAPSEHRAADANISTSVLTRNLAIGSKRKTGNMYKRIPKE